MTELDIRVGDARDLLKEMPDESVDCVATSPPFYMLRDYGVDGQIGLEATPDEWAAELVGVFRECRRVLRPSGTLWVECGDSYCADATSDRGLKPKDLLGQPFLLAFALRAGGWFWRGCYPWFKVNAMPESAKDRCTTAHSYVLHFAKNRRYFFDGDAIAEPAAWERWGDQTVPKYEGTGTASGWMQPRSKHELAALGGRTTNGQKPRTDERRGFDNRLERTDGLKHPRSVWSIPTRGFPGAHFATWPEVLAERILKAGCPEWVCKTCGKARERLSETQGEDPQPLHTRTNPVLVPGNTPRKTGSVGHSRTVATSAWSDCGHDNYQPGVVLDPFFGAGTTGLVALRLKRHCVGIELNPEYAEMARERCRTWWKKPEQPPETHPDQMSLLDKAAE